MSSTFFVSMICGMIAFNVALVIAFAFVIMRHIRLANKRCAEENRKERESIAAEYKNLAEKVTNALVQVGTALRDISTRLPITTKVLYNKDSEHG